MKIAIIGVRGIPVIYSGFETLAEELSTRLVKRGYEVVVYGRKRYVDKREKYKGVKTLVLPSIKNKHLDTFSHSLLATIHVIFIERPEKIIYLGLGNSIFAPLARLGGIRTIVHVDGLDWRREKWSKLAQSFFKFSEKLAIFGSNIVLTDSHLVERHYQDEYKQKIERISYGFDFGRKNRVDSSKLFDKYRIKQGRYIVWVGRLVPDNHLDDLLLSEEIASLPIVVIGGNSYVSEYEEKMKKIAKKRGRVVWTGYLERDKYFELVSKAKVYVETKTSGGIHPSLVEAVGMGVLIAANDLESTQEVVGEEYPYLYARGDTESLGKVVNKLWKLEPRIRTSLIEKMNKRVKRLFSWENKVEEYVELLSSD